MFEVGDIVKAVTKIDGSEFSGNPPDIKPGDSGEVIERQQLGLEEEYTVKFFNKNYFPVFEEELKKVEE